MISLNENLNPNIFDNPQKSSVREGFVKGVIEVAEKDERVVALTSDVMSSTKLNLFEEIFPNRFINVGVAEQALVTVASGMASYGKIPVVAAYAAFSPGRNWEQIRTTIALNNVPVIIMGTHTGLSCGPDGATHQILEDIALTRVIPNLNVYSPCDSEEARKLAIALLKDPHPSYIRFPREDVVDITTADTKFTLGKNLFFWDSMKNSKVKKVDVTLVSTGSTLYFALQAARLLEKEGIGSQVINAVNVKPFNNDLLIKSVKLTNCVVTVEDHQIKGGLGGLVSEIISSNYPVLQDFVGVTDSFGESGKPEELYKKHKITDKEIVLKVKDLIGRKNTF